MNIELYLTILLFCPLLGFILSGVLGKYLPKNVSGVISTLAVAVPFFAAVTLFLNYNFQDAPLVYKAFEWFHIGKVPVNFGFQIDQLSLMMTLIITGIGTLIHIYSIGYMSHDKGFPRFFSYLNLFIFSMLLLVLGSNYIIMFIGWEGVGLCSFLLIGFWFKNKEYTKAARKAFIMNRIGDLGVLLGIFMISKYFGTIEYLQIAHSAEKFTTENPILIIIGVCLFIGAVGKSAQLPLFTWLPDAMAGPTPVSALIHAATMVTAGIYLVVRSNWIYSHIPTVQDGMLLIGLLTAAIAAFMALRQNDIKKVLAYSTVSQLGFMVVALGLGAYTVAMFHLLTHAFFKALLFLGSGSVIHAMSGEQDLNRMGGLKNYIPTTHITFLVGTLAISGFPFLSGMISKDAILISAWEKNPIYWVILFFIAMCTAFYMFRLYYLTFYGRFRGTEEQKSHLHESPISMTIPLIVLAILSLIGGFINLPHIIGHGNYAFLDKWLSGILYIPIEVPHVEPITEYILMGCTVAMFFLVWLYSHKRYAQSKEKVFSLKQEKEYTGWERLSSQKLFLDELYNAVFVKTVEGLGRAASLFDKAVISRITNFIGEGAEESGVVMKKVQNGKVENYVLIMSVAVGLILLLNLFLFK